MQEATNVILFLGLVIIYGFLTFLLLAKGNEVDSLKNKIINPPEAFPCGILFFISAVMAFIFSGIKISVLSLLFIIVGICAVILRSQQVKDLKKIYQYQQTKEYVIKNIKTKSDEFKKSHHFKGPKIFGKTSIGKIYFYCFASGLEKEKGTLLLVGLFNHKYNFSQEAYDNQGNKIYISTHIDETTTSYQTSYQDPNQRITNQRGDIIGQIEGQTHYETHYQTEYTESFAISLPLESIKNIGSEYQIKLYGNKDVIVDIPSWYIQAFVEGIKNKPEFNKIKWQ